MPRLDALLARALGLSRKQATRLCRAKVVREPGGPVLDDPRLRLTPSELPRTLEVDGEPVVLRTRFELLLHKPVGVVTAHDDARHATAFALLRDAPLWPDLRAVGRLDLDTSGLLLWTTDGTVVHRLTHPRYAIRRTYHVGLARPWADPTPQLCLDDGYRPNITELVRLQADATHPALRRSPAATDHASITITTGRFHEVRRIFAALGSEVLDLCRVRYGPIELPEDLAAGDWREMDVTAVFRGRDPVVPPEDAATVAG